MEAVHSLAEDWARAGIHPGDTVLIHSSLKQTLRRCHRKGLKVSPATILDSFLEALGSSGTLLLPLFNFDFTKGSPFDIRTTPSQMGSLTEEGRLRPQALRTGHPIYSFAVLGHHAERFRDVNNVSGYGSDSPFAILRELGGKIAVLSLSDQHSMTFYHHVEEMCEVPYRYHKSFTAPYTDSAGFTDNRTYSLFVRNIEAGVVTHVNPAGELLWKEGLYSGERHEEGAGLRVISAQAMYDAVVSIIRSGQAEGLLYRVEKVEP